jgi:hypothetical protein
MMRMLNHTAKQVARASTHTHTHTQDKRSAVSNNTIFLLLPPHSAEQAKSRPGGRRVTGHEGAPEVGVLPLGKRVDVDVGCPLYFTRSAQDQVAQPLHRAPSMLLPPSAFCVLQVRVLFFFFFVSWSLVLSTAAGVAERGGEGFQGERLRASSSPDIELKR